MFNSDKKQNRVMELDFLRGFAIIMMILHHFIYDLRYIFMLDVFAIQETYFFSHILRPPFVFIFLFVSGVSCTFSKNNFLRALKLIVVALIFSTVFFAVSEITETRMYVIFNVLHLLGLGTILYSLINYAELKSENIDSNKIYLFLTVFLLWLYYPLSKIEESKNIILSALHENFAKGIGMGDYMPIIPWLGLFFCGVLFGRLYYTERKTLFPNTPNVIKTVFIPFEFIGRNSLVFYIFHQPVMLGILYLLRISGII